MRRRREGFPLAEVIRAMTATRRVLWFRLKDMGIHTIMTPETALELNNKVVLFFDRLIYFTTVGYDSA